MTLPNSKMKEAFADDDDDSIGIGIDSSIDDEATASGKGGSTTGTSTDDQSRDSDDDFNSIQNQISRKETKDVFRLRIITVMILIFVAAGVSAGVYQIMTRAEETEFENQFEGTAEKIIESFEEIMVKISSVSALAIATSAHSIDLDSEWPFVQVSNFQQRAGNARESSGALYVSVNPIVEAGVLNNWETYILEEENNQWM